VNEYQVNLVYGTHYVVADDYSVSGGFYIFWIGKTNVRMFPEKDVESVTLKGRAKTEKPR
jgi:hypothetical protein